MFLYLTPSDPEALFYLSTFLIDCSWIHRIQHLQLLVTVSNNLSATTWKVAPNGGLNFCRTTIPLNMVVTFSGYLSVTVTLIRLSRCCEIFDLFFSSEVDHRDLQGTREEVQEETWTLFSCRFFNNYPIRAIRANKTLSICRRSTRSLERIFLIVMRSLNDFGFIFLKGSKKFAVGKDEHRRITKSFNAFWPLSLVWSKS